MQTPWRAPAAYRDVVESAGWRFAGHGAPEETETSRGRLASLWLTWPGADDGDGGGDGRGGYPHRGVGSSPAGGGEVEGDDWGVEKGRDEAHDHQKTTLRIEDDDEVTDFITALTPVST